MLQTYAEKHCAVLHMRWHFKGGVKVSCQGPKQVGKAKKIAFAIRNVSSPKYGIRHTKLVTNDHQENRTDIRLKSSRALTSICFSCSTTAALALAP